MKRYIETGPERIARLKQASNGDDCSTRQLAPEGIIFRGFDSGPYQVRGEGLLLRDSGSQEILPQLQKLGEIVY